MFWIIVFAGLVPAVIDAATILALAAVVIAPLVGFAAANRKLSGSIQTSEAADLWTEVERQRDWSQRRIEQLQATCHELELTAEAAEARVIELERDNAALHTEVEMLRQQLESRA
jgi:septal ring factor EnvC (AmiA/AmiB activator)